MNNLPKNWKWVKLGEVCEKMSNGASAKQSDDKIGFPISRIETIWNETIDLNRVKYIQENDETFVAKYSLQKDDILFSHINSDIHLGKTAIFKNQTKTLIHGINLLLIRLSKDAVADFFNYQFRYKRRKGEFISIAQKSVNQSSINQPKLKNVDFVLPPTATQQAIVSKIEELFSELDKGIENLRTVQQQLKTYRQSVLKWAFEGKLTNENVKEGELPKGWKWLKIEEATVSLDNKRKPINKEERKKRIGTIPYYGANGQVGWIDDYIFDEPLVCVVEDETFTGREIPFSYKITGKSWVNNHAHVLKPKDNLNIDFLNYQLQYYPFLRLTTGTTGRKKLTKNALMNAQIKICSSEEQAKIVSLLESRLSLADKMEETITQSLEQAETLRQSILKKAFEGKLVIEKQAGIYKPKNEYFYQMQILGLIAKASQKNNIEHGEMTIAKYAYLLDKIYHIPTYYDFQRWHLGPYPPEIKKAINNKQFFKKENGNIQIADGETLFKYKNPYTENVDAAVDDLSIIFSKYSGKERSHKTELIATVCKVIEDIRSTEFIQVRESMKNWKIDLKSTFVTNKFEKFSDDETKMCLAFLVEKGWDKRLIN